MANSVSKVQAKFQKHQQQKASMLSSGQFNRQNLSKSIILHHSKLSSLLSMAGRYNDILVRQDMDEDLLGSPDHHHQQQIHEGEATQQLTEIEDDEYVVRNPQAEDISGHIKVVNSGQVVHSVQDTNNLRKLPFQAKRQAPIFDNFASQNSGHTYDTASFYQQQRLAGGGALSSN